MIECQENRLTLTVAQAASALGISRGAAYEAVKTGELPTLRIGRRVLVPRAALMRMLDAAAPVRDDLGLEVVAR